MKAGLSLLGREHYYLSTACLHGEHDLCRLRCRFCSTGCICPCHQPQHTVVRPPDVDIVGEHLDSFRQKAA